VDFAFQGNVLEIAFGLMWVLLFIFISFWCHLLLLF
jgi:hypothetical protein